MTDAAQPLLWDSSLQKFVEVLKPEDDNAEGIAREIMLEFDAVKQRLVAQALTRRFGEKWCLDYIKRHGEMTHEEESTTFYIDGYKLIRFSRKVHVEGSPPRRVRFWWNGYNIVELCNGDEMVNADKREEVTVWEATNATP